MVHIWRVRKDGFAVKRGGVGAFAEEATEVAGDTVVLPPAATDAATARRPTSGRRVRLLGVVDRESVTAEERLTDDTVFTWPHLLVRHVVVGLGVAAAVLALGVAFAAPLRGIANPNLTPEPAKAPWYFVGLQELLSHFDPLVAGILVPGGCVLVLVAAAVHRPQPGHRGPESQGRHLHLLDRARRSRSCSRSSAWPSAARAGSSSPRGTTLHRAVRSDDGPRHDADCCATAGRSAARLLASAAGWTTWELLRPLTSNAAGGKLPVGTAGRLRSRHGHLRP